MTVAELVAKLSEYPDDLPVQIAWLDQLYGIHNFDPIIKVAQLTGNGDDMAWHPVDWADIGTLPHHHYYPDEVDERAVIWIHEVL